MLFVRLVPLFVLSLFSLSAFSQTATYQAAQEASYILAQLDLGPKAQDAGCPTLEKGNSAKDGEYTWTHYSDFGDANLEEVVDSPFLIDILSVSELSGLEGPAVATTPGGGTFALFERHYPDAWERANSRDRRHFVRQFFRAINDNVDTIADLLDIEVNDDARTHFLPGQDTYSSGEVVRPSHSGAPEAIVFSNNVCIVDGEATDSAYGISSQQLDCPQRGQRVRMTSVYEFSFDERGARLSISPSSFGIEYQDENGVIQTYESNSIDDLRDQF